MPHGYTVTNPALEGSVAVMLTSTADALIGTPPRVLTSTEVIVDAERRPMPRYLPSNVAFPPVRVSSRRAGDSAVKLEFAG